MAAESAYSYQRPDSYLYNLLYQIQDWQTHHHQGVWIFHLKL